MIGTMNQGDNMENLEPQRNPEIPDEFLNMALGRLFLMGSRPTQSGDIETYNKIKEIFMEAYQVS